MSTPIAFERQYETVYLRLCADCVLAAVGRVCVGVAPCLCGVMSVCPVPCLCCVCVVGCAASTKALRTSIQGTALMRYVLSTAPIYPANNSRMHIHPAHNSRMHIHPAHNIRMHIHHTSSVCTSTTHHPYAHLPHIIRMHIHHTSSVCTYGVHHFSWLGPPCGGP